MPLRRRLIPHIWSSPTEFLDNNFATSVRKITVTIRSSDGQFTSEGCEVWKPVK
ncbi:hypothetical protein ACFWV1_33020 [Streptomyces sp. NPDC058700]|uniref:hypothetical protein n=1 Tax=unclassified Streptomyces TaxID=2593676 RepID=UPI003661D4C6